METKTIKKEPYWLSQTLPDGTTVAIRSMVPADYDALIAIWHQAQLPYKPKGRDSRKKVLEEIKQPDVDLLVADVDGEVVGSILATRDSRKGWINRLAVKESHRLKGIAHLLVTEAEKLLHQKGIEIIACLIEDYNLTSMDFFQKAGYIRHSDIIYFSKRKHKDV